MYINDRVSDQKSRKGYFTEDLRLHKSKFLQSSIPHVKNSFKNTK